MRKPAQIGGAPLRCFAALICLSMLLVCLAPGPMYALREVDPNSPALQTGPRGARGMLVVEVLEIMDRTPVAGIRVELLQTGQSACTDGNGRVRFAVAPGEYDVRIYDLNGPGPSLRFVDEHATVTLGRPVVIQAFDCSACV